MGWKYGGVVDWLECQRKVSSQAYYERKMMEGKLQAQAKINAGLQDIETKLQSYGYQQTWPDVVVGSSREHNVPVSPLYLLLDFSEFK
mmetsp:Transcript_7994/g.16075  ORF Transcript_7994/g.16075 Transcript_7994/m.16075 type:complete len:88 (+) Transcript_7994:245-508(+)